MCKETRREWFLGIGCLAAIFSMWPFGTRKTSKQAIANDVPDQKIIGWLIKWKFEKKDGTKDSDVIFLENDGQPHYGWGNNHESPITAEQDAHDIFKHFKDSGMDVEMIVCVEKHTWSINKDVAYGYMAKIPSRQ